MIYNLFISHSWSYPDAYSGLANLLNKKPGFSWKDYSVPKDSPIHNAPTTAKLRDAIKNQMRLASCVLILAGVYATYSKWINIEIDLAKKLGKKIIAIEPFGSEKTSSFVKKAADKIVGWNTDAIIKAISS